MPPVPPIWEAWGIWDVWGMVDVWAWAARVIWGDIRDWGTDWKTEGSPVCGTSPLISEDQSVTG